jgi:hypothetical protein
VLVLPTVDQAFKLTDPINFQWQFVDPDVNATQTQADIRYRLVGAANWTELSAVATTGNTYQLAGSTLTAGQYEWQARTSNSNGVVGPYSTSQTFAVLSAPAAPTGMTPGSLTTLRTSTPSLSATRAALPAWQPAKMEWQFATDAAFTQNVVTYQSSTSSVGTSVSDTLPAANRLAQGIWYGRVRQVDSLGQYSDYYSQVSNFTISHPPAVASLSPTGAAYIAASAANVFSWTFSDTSSTDKQTAFQIICENNATGESVFDTGKVASTLTQYTRDLTAVPLDELLRWKIRVWDTDDVVGAYSDYQLFYVGDAPLVVVTPGDQSIVNTNRPTISWDLTIGGNRYQTYWLVIVTDRVTNQTIASSSGTDQSTRLFQPSGAILANGRDYAITVTIQDSSGLSSTVTSSIHSQFDAPEEVVYFVNATSVNDNGYVSVNWSQETPDPDFINYKVYRRESSLSDWQLVATVSDVTVTEYHDWLVQSGSNYQWTVTQTVVRFGIELESSLGYRATLLPEPRVNLSTNPSFDIGIANWSEYQGTGGTSEITRETVDSYEGTGFIRIAYTEPPSLGVFAGLQQDFDVEPGTVYTASCYIKQNQAAMIHATLLNGDEIVADAMQEQTLVTDEWVRVSISGIAPVGAVTLTFAVYSSVDITAGYALDVDAVLIEQGDTVGTFFDGYTSGAHWNGATGLSTSTLDKTITAETDIFTVEITEYWILNYQDPSMNVKIPSVTADSYTDEWEEQTFTLIGRGRKKDYGTHLGRNGTLTAKVRGYDDIPKITRLQISALKDLQATYYLRIPFGDLIPVGLGNIGIDLLAGTGTSEMYDITIPYEELSTSSVEPAANVAKQPARMQVIDNGDGTLTLVPLSDGSVFVDPNDIVEIDI